MVGVEVEDDEDDDGLKGADAADNLLLIRVTIFDSPLNSFGGEGRVAVASTIVFVVEFEFTFVGWVVLVSPALRGVAEILDGSANKISVDVSGCLARYRGIDVLSYAGEV